VTNVEFKHGRATGVAVLGDGVTVAELASTKTETAAGSLSPFAALVARTIIVCGPTVARHVWITVNETCGVGD
jgi:hypothetical protein